MFGWLKRKRPTPPVRGRPPEHDPVLGSMEWDGEQEAWVVQLPESPGKFRILLAGEERPDTRLVLHARDIFTAPEKLLGEVETIIKSLAREVPEAAREILGLKIESVALMWPDRPDDGMIYFDGPDTDERVWRCDYVGRRPQVLGFDD
jgi:hypothetical protein